MPEFTDQTIVPQAAAAMGVGAEDIDAADAVTASLVISFALSRPALGKSDRLACTAILMLSQDNPDAARQLAIELTTP